MKAYKRVFTERHPWLYVVETESYIVQTINEAKWELLQVKMTEQGIGEFDVQQILKLQAAGFDVKMKG